MTKNEETLNCGKCQKGTVKVIVKQTKFTTEMSVKKCTNCKYQYGIKEISNAEAAQRVLRVDMNDR